MKTQAFFGPEGDRGPDVTLNGSLVGAGFRPDWHAPKYEQVEGQANIASRNLHLTASAAYESNARAANPQIDPSLGLGDATHLGVGPARQHFVSYTKDGGTKVETHHFGTPHIIESHHFHGKYHTPAEEEATNSGPSRITSGPRSPVFEMSGRESHELAVSNVQHMSTAGGGRGLLDWTEPREAQQKSHYTEGPSKPVVTGVRVSPSKETPTDIAKVNPAVNVQSYVVQGRGHFEGEEGKTTDMSRSQMHVYTHPDYPEKAVVDVPYTEVNPSYKKMGISQQMLPHAAAALGLADKADVQGGSSTGFTPEGSKAFKERGHAPRPIEIMRRHGWTTPEGTASAENLRVSDAVVDDLRTMTRQPSAESLRVSDAIIEGLERERDERRGTSTT